MAQVCGYKSADQGLDQQPGFINTSRFLLRELLMWQVEQPNLRDETKTHAIRDARCVLGRMMGRSPLLKSMLGRMLDSLYQDMRSQVCQEVNLPVDHFPARCPYAVADILSPFFFPTHG